MMLDSDETQELNLFNGELYITVHNVKVIDISEGEGGYQQLKIEHEGNEHILVGCSKFQPGSTNFNVGKIGYVKSDYRMAGIGPAFGFNFYPYVDQSLRRVPELDFYSDDVDGDGRLIPVVGWSVGSPPRGFRAPIGIVPGENGWFVADETVELKIRVPKEFVELAKRYGESSEGLLKSFIADVCGLQNFLSNPRADGFQSNGSDERDYAEAWLERSYGHNEVDLNELSSAEEKAEDRAMAVEDFDILLDEYLEKGGMAKDLIDHVKSLIEKNDE